MKGLVTIYTDNIGLCGDIV